MVTAGKASESFESTEVRFILSFSNHRNFKVQDLIREHTDLIVSIYLLLSVWTPIETISGVAAS